MRNPTREEMDYVRAMISEKWALCWWCERRPKSRAADECLADMDWRECAAMGRRACPKFRLDFARMDAKESESRRRDPNQTLSQTLSQIRAKPEQLNIDFAGDGK
ncbi:MAG: hypothetical protein LBO82_06075 [Synergistaceae bacterium]|jgi:hypothetical protein|nr:hypothetical protein [Synergistaceae bacterium]